VAETCRLAPELEFFVFDDVRFDQATHEAFYHVDSAEGAWNRGRAEGPNLGYKPRSALGFFPCPPTDSQADLRTEMAQILAECGIGTAAHFHEAATAGQGEIDLLAQPLVECADQVMLARYIVRNVARKHGKAATFMPKPLFGENGSGLHTHLSLWKGETPLLAGDGYAGLSDLGMYAIGGLLKHARALCAFANPTTNSYKRLVPGFEAPTKLAYSRRNRAAVIRIPVHGPGPRSRRIEYRCPDGAANPYLLFSAMLMAALDGIQTKTSPGEPLDKDIYDLPPEELDDVATTPRSLAPRSTPAGRPRVPAAGRRLHPRRHRHLDLVQAHLRGRGGAHPPPSLRVRALLRCLTRESHGVPSPPAGVVLRASLRRVGPRRRMRCPQPLARHASRPRSTWPGERRSATRHEYRDGYLFEKAGANRAHNLIAGSLSSDLGSQLRDRPCEVYISDMRVYVEPTGLYTYPDVVVVCDAPRFQDGELDTLLNPTVLVEVLSPSTEAYDRGKKFGHYRRLPSAREYVLVAQDRVLVERFTRQGRSGSWPS
jgi:Uma2 family endonuclease